MEKPIKLKVEYGYDPDMSHDFGFYWPEQPTKLIEFLQARKTRPAIAEAVYQCNPGALEGNIFKLEDFVYYAPPTRLRDGFNVNREFLNSGFDIIQSWDTAFSSENDSDYSVCVTGELISVEGTPEEKALGEDTHVNVRILDVFREQIDFGALVSCALVQNKKWRPSVTLVEKKATGEPLIQLLTNSGINVTPVNPGIKSKRLRAVQGVESGSAQGWMQQHRIQFPLEADWLDSFRKELVNFTGIKDSYDDQVDAFIQLINYAISSQTEMGVVGEIMPFTQNPPKDGLEALVTGLTQDVNIPGALQYMLCGNCSHFVKNNGFCNFHRRPTTFFDTCENFEPKSDQKS